MGLVSRRDFLALGSAAATGAVWPVAYGAQRQRAGNYHFPYGTHIYREPPLPIDELTADLPLIKRLGFNMVKIQESWSADERHPGEIDLSRIERLVGEANRNELLVYFGVTMEQAPAWLWRKFPDATMVYEDGTPHNDPTQYLLPSDGKPGPCWHHPGARAAAETFIQAVATQIGKYPNVAVWNVFQEIALNPWNTRPGHKHVCYCTNTLVAYRSWLQSRYASLDELNSAWRTSFGEWSEVEPPRLSWYVPSIIDWRVFMESVYLSDVLAWKAAAIRRGDPNLRPVMAHTPGPTPGSAVDWDYARSLDIYGTSLYPGWGEPEDVDVNSSQRVEKSDLPLDELWGIVMLRLDYIRSASPSGRIWTAELQGGRAGGGPVPGRVPDTGDIRRWVLGSLAAGAQGISFWNHRNEILWSETSGFGLLERTGDSTARAEEAGRLGRAIESRAELFLESVVPPNDVAIAISERLFQFVSASEPPFLKTQLVASVRGMYKAMWANGFAVDFIDLDRSTKIGAYKVLLMPAPMLMSTRVARQCVDFVESGGTLISEATPGRFDEYGMGSADEFGPGLAQLFGVAHERLAAWQNQELDIPSAEQRPHWSVSGVGPLAGLDGQGSLYLQTLQLRGAKPLLTHGQYVVGTTHVRGKGNAILIGTVLGSGIVETQSDGNAKILAALINQAGVRPDIVGRLLRRRRILGSASAWFFINPTHERVRESVNVGGAHRVDNLLSGRLDIVGREVSLDVAPFDIECVLLS